MMHLKVLIMWKIFGMISLTTSFSSAYQNVFSVHQHSLPGNSASLIENPKRFGLGHEIFISTRRCSKIEMFSSPDPDKDENSPQSYDKFLERFLSPRLDDPGLPLADVLIAQVVGPFFQVLWLILNRAPSPTWVNPISITLFPTKGSLLAPTLIHGAGLASCWIAGALAARGFESDAFDVSNGKGYGVVIERLIKGGAFATGILILSTQLDLLFEYGRWILPGESDEVDVRLLSASVEVLNDIFFEAITLSSWRIYRASLTADR
mmetsp:Transcript_35934/g.43276  ORF Transcript_35934/g.43276 Transcript_35934/m.43276 type:complete len:264 (-) Transcript_35934:325-1116(-)